MDTKQYLEAVNQHYKSGYASEHTYRGDLASLLQALAPDINVTNEPSNATDCGNPDYVLTRKKIPIGFIEAKDIGKNLDSKHYYNQFKRYRDALDNLIITDYLNFRFYIRGELVREIRIGEAKGKVIRACSENFSEFENSIKEFCTYVTQTIKSPRTLAKMMAAKARLLENILENAITSDEDNEENTALKSQYEVFKKILIHDLTPKGFADIYSQTLAYGMFAARLHDTTLESFSRQEAAELIPKSNPFLRKLFSHIAGVDIDDRIITTVDNLASVFRATNVEQLLKNFGSRTQTNDPIIHFYETFLAEYDPNLRKVRGVWYTPAPAVSFIVKGVDHFLKTRFGLEEGLSDTEKTTVKLRTDKPDRRTKSGYVELEKEIHKVQILDPATGTGTFLAEVVKHIYNKKFKSIQGAWNGYVENELIPRMNGFELLMASYAMAHLKLDLLLSETGYVPSGNKRFNIFLTNSLEEYHPDTGTLFSSWLSAEANEANNIKRDTPVMVVIGNPPYSGISQNNGKWISNLIENYKYVDGKHFGERKHWLNDDYVKFIRLGQYLINKNEEGILAYINNHSFIDNPTFRGMRQSLLNDFDEIWIVDLNGDTKKAKLIADGIDTDENVFDIQQGVSINFFIKTSKSKSKHQAKVYYSSYWGTREEKYNLLENNAIKDINFEEVYPKSPNYFFSPRDHKEESQYENFLSVKELFSTCTMGFASAQDRLTVAFDKNELWDTVQSFHDLGEEDIKSKYKIKKESRDWKVATAKKDIIEHYGKEYIQKVSYRPFDTRFTYYTGTSRGFFASPQRKVMYHLGRDDNLAFCTCRMNRDHSATYWVAGDIISKSIISSLDNGYVFPLYLYPDEGGDIDEKRVPNFNKEEVKKITEKIGLPFSPENNKGNDQWCPFDLLDYIYAVLHSRKYLETYKEFLKTDFPRVPYPTSKDKFWEVAELGKALRECHLMVNSGAWEVFITFPESGSNMVINKITKKDFEVINEDSELGRVWINDSQCFDNIPIHLWNMSVGGYQPAQKWLKDRSGRKLGFSDIMHYQKILSGLEITQGLTDKIDLIINK